MLIKHVRDDFRQPFATIVALSTKEIGVSICSSKDSFNKRLGIAIAEGRAKTRSPVNVPNQSVVYNGSILYIDEVLDMELARMEDRALRYFV